jgi:uncharacterized protein (TIGR02246 family)
MQTQERQETTAEAVVEALCRSYASAVNASDSAAYSELFATDAVRMPPGREVEHGREQIRNGEQADYDRVELEVRSTPGDVLRLSEDSIYAIAHIEGTATAHADGERSSFRATKTWLLRLQDDGTWRIARQMWNMKPSER